jgi:tRNA (guanine37-N1)-methyltransferase
MIRFDVLTIFPGYFESPLRESLLGKAIAKGLVSVDVHDIRSFAPGPQRRVDDEPYGGGAGMVLTAPVVATAIESVRGPGTACTVLLTPAGRPLSHAWAAKVAATERTVLVCGRYEGIDERVVEAGLVDEEISVGDFVLAGGEAAALVVIEAASRLVPGVVKEAESVARESFASGLLDYPHYTRPREWRGLTVPDVLISGNHEEIRRWREREALERTRLRRPDLLRSIADEP